MLAAWEIFLSGMALGITIAAPPGPVNAASAGQAARSWMSGWLVLLGATTADGLFFTLTYLGLTALATSKAVKDSLFLGGAILMFYLAYATLRSAKKPTGGQTQTRRTYPYLLGFGIGISNPFQLAWWLTVGIGMVSSFGLSIVSGFFCGIVVWTLVFATVVHASAARYLTAYKAIVYGSGLVLVVFGLWFLYTAISAFA